KEEIDPIEAWLGPQAKRLVREVNCAIASTIKTALDRAFCKGLEQCVRGTCIRYKSDDEIVTYHV
ncbi:MAG: hypothetical protein ACREAN_04150, partial [Nitrosopumilaceae archaeon]